MIYRTRTYVAGDWTGDKNAIDQLYRWNNSNYWGLSFSDAHDLHQSNDNSLNCSIKQSLCQRMDASKTFVLIVGNKTKSLTAGSCQYCASYRSLSCSCTRGHGISLKSYIEYECEKAIRDNLKIIVLYNSTFVNKSRCPDCIKNYGIHVPMKTNNGIWGAIWDYFSVKNAFDRANLR